MSRATAIAVSILALACDGDAGKATPGPADKPPQIVKPALTAERPSDESTAIARVHVTIRAWLAAQNKRDIKAYAAVYHPQKFWGTKRTRAGTEVRMPFAEWRNDRARMFKRPQRVAADQIEITTWISRPDLGEGRSEATFVQRFRVPGYADHGPKVLRFEHGGNGVALIVGEEMRSSSSGWSDRGQTKPIERIDGTAMASPITVSLRWSTPPQHADRIALMLRLVDSGGSSLEKQVFWYEQSMKPAPVKPNNSRTLLYEARFAFDGGEDTYRVIRDADGLVVKQQVSEEGADEDQGTWPFEDRIRISLGKETVVVAK